MRTTRRILTIGAILGLCLMAVCSSEQTQQRPESEDTLEVAAQTHATPGYGSQAGHPAGTAAGAGLPRMVDLGRGKCIPCKLMEPILKELREEYAGRAIIEVIDLNEDEEAAARYGINVIPTQVFFDAAGKEVWRHQGFLSKDAIVEKLTELGVEPIDQ